MGSQQPQKVVAAIERFKVKVEAMLVRGYRRFERRMIIEHLSGHSASSLGRRTGQLARSLKMNGPQVAGNKLRIGASIGNASVPYAKIHETGGTVRAKAGKALAVPIGAMLTKAGVGRQPSPRDIPGLVMIKRGGRPPLLVRPRGKTIQFKTIDAKKGERTAGRGGMDLMFVLLKSVYIPPRLHFLDTWNEEAAVTKREVDALAKATFGGAKK